MSHEATSWAIKQRGLKPATKVVLFYLADRHNPDFGCFPSQKTLAADAEMSERSVRDHLDILEARGLIARATGHVGGQFKSNRYLLGFEADFQRQDLPSAKSASGEIASAPTAEFAADQRQDLPPNLVTEPCNGTRKEQEEGAGAKHVDLTLVSKLTHALGFDHHGQTPRYWISPDAALIVARWQTDLGLTPEEIIHVATGNMRVHGTPANGPKTLTRHMQDFAAAKDAPRLEPTKGSPNANPGYSSRRQHTGQDQQLSGLAGAAMRRRNARQQGYEG